MSVEREIRASVERLQLPGAAWCDVAAILEPGSAPEAIRAEATSLSELEQDAYSRYRAPKRRMEFLAGRLAAKRAVARALGHTTLDELEIPKESDGAPAVRRHPELHVSISHSFNIAIAIAATRPIGIDLEREEPRSDALARWFFCDNELRLLATKRDADWHALVNLLWTRKEAISKVGRWGGSLQFRHFDCTKLAVRIGDSRIRIHSARKEGYVVSVAYEQRPGDLHG